MAVNPYEDYYEEASQEVEKFGKENGYHDLEATTYASAVLAWYICNHRHDQHGDELD